VERGRARSSCLLVAAAIAISALAGCDTKSGPGGRFGREEQASGAASFRLAEAHYVLRAAPAKLLASKAYGDLAAAPENARVLDAILAQSPLHAVKEPFGVDPSAAVELLVSANTLTKNILVAVQMQGTIDRKSILDGAGAAYGGKLEEGARHDDVALYSTPGDDKQGVIAFPASRLLVMGTPDAVKKGIDRHRAGDGADYGAAMAGVLALTPKEADLAVALVMPPDLLADASSPLQFAATALVGQEEAEGIEAALLAVTAGEAFDVTLKLVTGSAEEGASMRARVEERVRKASASMAALSADAALRPLVDLVANAKVGGAERLVEVTFRVEPDVIGALGSKSMANAFGRAMGLSEPAPPP